MRKQARRAWEAWASAVPLDRDISTGDQERFLLLISSHLIFQQIREGTIDETADLRRLLAQLRLCYADDGSPYGEDGRGFRRWLLELWPTPPTAQFPAPSSGPPRGERARRLVRSTVR
jgi:hypothetical protein